MILLAENTSTSSAAIMFSEFVGYTNKRLFRPVGCEKVILFHPTCPEALIIAQDQTRNLPTHLDRIFKKGFRFLPKEYFLRFYGWGISKKLPTLRVIWLNCLLYPTIQHQHWSIPVSSVNLQEVVVGAYSTGTHMAGSTVPKVTKRIFLERRLMQPLLVVMKKKPTTSLHDCLKRKRISKQ